MQTTPGGLVGTEHGMVELYEGGMVLGGCTEETQVTVGKVVGGGPTV